MGLLLRITSLFLLAISAQAEVRSFVVPWANGAPVLPPMVSMTNGVQLCFTNSNKEVEGGYVVTTPVDRNTTKVVVLVNSTTNVLDAIAKMAQSADVSAVKAAVETGEKQDGLVKCEVCGKLAAKTVLCDACAKRGLLRVDLFSTAILKVAVGDIGEDAKPQ